MSLSLERSLSLIRLMSSLSSLSVTAPLRGCSRIGLDFDALGPDIRKGLLSMARGSCSSRAA